VAGGLSPRKTKIIGSPPTLRTEPTTVGEGKIKLPKLVARGQKGRVDQANVAESY